MKKITLEHLAPYLPYGLKIWNDYAHIIKTQYDEMNSHGGTGYEPIYNVVNYQKKPILRQLTDMDNELFDEMGFADEDDLISCVKEGAIVRYKFNKLIKHHFDVFGLIEAGLAIDINTLSNK